MTGKWVNFYVAVACVFLLAPIAIVIPSSFDTVGSLAFPPSGLTLKWYEQVLGNTAFLRAVQVSIVVALLSTVVSLGVGLLSCIAIVRYKPFGAAVLVSFFMLPIILPGIVIGVALAMMFSTLGLIGTYTALVLGHAIATIPYVVRVLLPALQDLDLSIEEAARVLGAGRWRTFWLITVPLLRHSLVTAVVFSSLVSLDELIISIFLSGSRAATLPVEMFNYAQHYLDPSMAAISTLVILLTLVIMAFVEKFVGLNNQFK
ncbi:ABC transporter permease [Mesorhizobium sp.]|uniref:ABC transporter permease n=1 Tax=Mesorhizobium sp. TaxID=1871066 RepID=UPI000FE7C250|nr:ABC transporter permease [Mesorhizobium sp.]RWJ05723.1 MAG: ABC transporter permease [Mesorhizobium sp.]